MKTILVFGAGKSATVLIDYLKTTVAEKNWKLIVADANPELAKAKLESMKDRVLRAFLDRQNTLDMYERSLEGSIDRLRHGL